MLSDCGQQSSAIYSNHPAIFLFWNYKNNISWRLLVISGNCWLKQKSFRLRNHFMVTCPHSGLDLRSGIISNIQESSRNIFVLKYSKIDFWYIPDYSWPMLYLLDKRMVWYDWLNYASIVSNGTSDQRALCWITLSLSLQKKSVSIQIFFHFYEEIAQR